MAFGDLISSGSASGANVAAANAITISPSAAVVVGDLVFCILAEQTTLTASGAIDNLGNTYVATNVGSDAGVITGRAFYARVTNAGTLTSVTINATASGDDFSCCAAVFSGPVPVSPADANPANVLNDIASPFTGPASGVLAQVNELVISWMMGDGNMNFAGSGGPITRVQSARQNSSCIIGSWFVTTTASVTSGYTSSTTPTATVHGLTTFKLAPATGTLATIEAADAAAFPGQVEWRGTMAAPEAADTLAMIGARYDRGGPLAVVEAGDIAVEANILIDADSWVLTSATRSGTLASATMTETTVNDFHQIDVFKTTNYPAGLYRFSVEFKFNGTNAANRSLTLGLKDDEDLAGVEWDFIRDIANQGSTNNQAPDNPLYDVFATQLVDLGGGFFRATLDAIVRETNGFNAYIGLNTFPGNANSYLGDGTTNATLNNVSLRPFDGMVDWRGTLSASEARDAAAIAGFASAFGPLATTEAADAAAFPGQVEWRGTIAATEARDTAAIAGSVAWTGTLAATETRDTAAITGSLAWAAILAAFEAADAAALAGTVRWDATLGAFEASDSAAIAGTIEWRGTLGAVELADDATFAGGIVATGALAATEAADMAAFGGAGVIITGPLAATEATDVAAFAGDVVAVVRTGTLAAVEAGDLAGITGTVPAVGITGTLAGLELTDRMAIAGLRVVPGQRTGTSSRAPSSSSQPADSRAASGGGAVVGRSNTQTGATSRPSLSSSTSSRTGGSSSSGRRVA